MADYDISEAFQIIEEEMIASMSRNLSRHLKKEKSEGINYSMWQAEQLAALTNFRKNNAKAFKGYFSTINSQIETILKMAHQSGAMDQETRILEAIKKGWKVNGLPTTDALQGAFFKINERKLNALIEATTKDMETAEAAMLRMADDEYRKVIFNSEVYYNTGAGTLSQCVDMATKDFLARGIACIEYANGARVCIDAYAQMALRTAQTRAYLAGEASMRDEWGVSTVIVNRRGVACPRCLQWVGRVFYDDVWGSAPIPSPQKYPLLSEAMAGGLYHPNCKDIHTTYFEGVNTPPKPMTAAEKEEAARVYNLEQQQRYNERQIRKYKRLSAGSVDPENREKYGRKLKAWQQRQRDFIAENGDVLKRRYENEKLRMPEFPEPPKIPKAPKKQELPEIPSIPEEQELPKAQSFTKGEKEALEWYVSGDGMWVNQHLRGIGDFGELSQNEQELIDRLTSATDRELPDDIPMLYRSVDASAVFGNMSDSQYEALRGHLVYGDNQRYTMQQIDGIVDRTKGRIITEKGFMSTTKSYDVASEWGGFSGSDKPIVLEFDEIPKGLRGADLKTLEIEGDEQFEVLLAQNTKYEIVDIYGKNGDIHVKARFIVDDVIDEIDGKALTSAAKDGIMKPLKMTADEEAALIHYISSESYSLNHALRTGTPLTAEQEVLRDGLISALDKLPSYEGTVYRSLSSEMIEDLEAFNRLHTPGNIVSYSAFTSTGIEVYDNSMDIQCIIRSKNGKDITEFNPDEHEVLFPPNTRFQVIDRQGNTIWMEEV